MGDNFLEEQAKNTKKRRARGAATIGRETLFKRPDQVTDQFTVDCHEGNDLIKGDILWCFQNADGKGVDVIQKHKTIGLVVAEGGGAELAVEIGIEGVGQLRVVSFDSLSGAAQVERVQGN